MKKRQHSILLTSFVMTVIIFVIGILISYWLDFERIDEINKLIQEHEIDNEAFLLEQNFLDASGGAKCSAMENRMLTLNEEIIQVGKDLSSYGDKSIFKKSDFETLRREYFLLQLKFYLLTKDINQECEKTYIPIIFFYEADDPISERQGFILDEITDAYIDEVVVTSIDKDYDKEPLITFLVKKYNITKAPSIVINDRLAFDELAYTGEINATILKIKRVADPYARDFDFDYIFRATGMDKQDYIDNLELGQSNFSNGDILYIKGRLLENDTVICSSLAYYDNYDPLSREEQALVYETYVSVGCGRNRRAFLLEAAKIWDELGNHFRAELDRDLAMNEKIEFEFEEVTLESDVRGYHSLGKVVIGGSSFEADRTDLLISQADRVNRDWLSYQLNNSPGSESLLTVFSESLTYKEKDLLPEIGWHEGARIKEISEAGIPRDVAIGTLVVKKDEKWYAPNEEGVFMFEVPIDKVSYPTTRFLTDDIAVVIDTHGVNMLVEQAMRKNATLVIGCCDHPGKIAAARYLAEKGKKVVCFTDKYLPLILGHNGTILGSPPFLRNGNRIIFGDRPVSIDISNTIIVSNVSDYEKVQSYYDTPARYFHELEKFADIDVFDFEFSEPNQTYALVETARIYRSSVIGVRVFNYDDYNAVRQWLLEDPGHIAVMFHSYSYPYGYRLMNEFPDQTTFDDINPIII